MYWCFDFQNFTVQSGKKKKNIQLEEVYLLAGQRQLLLSCINKVLPVSIKMVIETTTNRLVQVVLTY